MGFGAIIIVLAGFAACHNAIPIKGQSSARFRKIVKEKNLFLSIFSFGFVSSGNIDSKFIRVLYIHSITCYKELVKCNKMKHLASKKRKILKTKMAEAFNDKIQDLSASMQDILLDDLVTAFESRFEVLTQTQVNSFCFADMGVRIPNATIQA